MTKYHITKNGDIAECKATSNKCPLDTPHIEAANLDEASTRAAEALEAAEAGHEPTTEPTNADLERKYAALFRDLKDALNDHVDREAKTTHFQQRFAGRIRNAVNLFEDEVSEARRDGEAARVGYLRKSLRNRFQIARSTYSTLVLGQEVTVEAEEMRDARLRQDGLESRLAEEWILLRDAKQGVQDAKRRHYPVREVGHWERRVREGNAKIVNLATAHRINARHMDQLEGAADDITTGIVFGSPRPTLRDQLHPGSYDMTQRNGWSKGFGEFMDAEVGKPQHASQSESNAGAEAEWRFARSEARKAEVDGLVATVA